MITRRHVVRSCKQRGWTIQPGALRGILELAETEDEVELILDQIGLLQGGSGVVTDDVWAELVEAEADPPHPPPRGAHGKGSGFAGGSSRGGGGRANDAAARKGAGLARAGDRDSCSSWSVVNAFETPKLAYEAMRKQFYVEEKRYSLFGTAQDKANMMRQRYALIHQRLLRHDFFRPTDLSRNSAKLKLVPIESLLGSTLDHPVLLLGLLLQIEEGQWYLEDPTGQIQVSFQTLSRVDDMFVTEHCVLVVEGRLHDGVFYVAHVGNPMAERREVSLSAIRRQVSHPAYGGVRPSGAGGGDGSSSFVFLSDVHLDQPRVLRHLEALLARHEKLPPPDLPVFVLMGSFSSSREVPAPLDELAALVSAFPSLKRHARFVLVPGPNDAPGYTLPAANSLLQSSSSSSARSAGSSGGGASAAAALGRMNVTWATNPCRIRNPRSGREIVVFRYDLLHFFQRQQLFLPRGGGAGDSSRHRGGSGDDHGDDDDAMRDEDDDNGRGRRDVPLHVRLIKTVLGQAHLLPASGVPVAWNYDHALGLYPLPSLLVLGGDGPGSEEGGGGTTRYHEVCEGCRVLHPGSATTGSFAVYRDGGGCEEDGDEDDNNDDDDSDHGSGPRVEFGNLGVEK